jgi:ankyrin repeat protein
LLDKSADAKRKGVLGQAPLTRAAFSGNTASLRKLLEAGAKPDSQALVAAIWSRKVEPVQVLLDAGARPVPEALEAAAAFGHTELVLLFLNEGVPPDAGLAGAARRGNLELLRLLLAKGAQVNHKARGGRTALHAAAGAGKVDAVRFLLQQGADPNITNERDETPLHRAILEERNLEVIKLLVAAGAKLDIPNNEGVTPVRFAAIRGEKEAYDFLLAAAGGAEPLPAAKQSDQPTAELISQLKSKERKVRISAQRELVLRGTAVLPEVLQSFQAERDHDEVGYLYELFQAMGPQADVALPLLKAQFAAGSKHAWIAAITMEIMKPGALEELDGDAKQKLAKALYEGATLGGEMAGYYADTLVRLGSEAAPVFLHGLRHEEPRVRELMAGSLEISPFADPALQAELIELLSEDPRPSVRAKAANALGNPKFRSEAAKEALLEAWRDPPRWREPTDYVEYHGVERKKRHENYLWNSEVSDFNRDLTRAIAAYGPEIIDDLLPSVLTADDAESQRLAAPWKYLGVEAVEPLLQHEEERVRKIAAEQLARLAKENNIRKPAGHDGAP